MFEFEKHRILLLGGSGRFMQYDNIDVEEVYHIPDKAAKRKFKLYEHLPFVHSMREWYGSWADRVQEYDTFIILDGIRGTDVIEYIQKNNPQARIILYYVNTFTDGARNDPAHYKKYGCEIYSFDRRQAQKAAITFRHYFYEYEEEYEEIKNLPADIRQDILFIGSDKGRMKSLQELEREFSKSGLSFYYQVVPDKRAKYTKEQSTHLLKERIPYTQIAKAIAESRAVLDFTSAGQSGITLRSMECIFFGKKLITNNDDVVHYDFYNENNVFLLNQRDLAELPQFMSTEFLLDKDATSRYTKEYWMESFFRQEV